ncbi:MAG: serine hydrolase [Bryobacterales bacterium]|nr:serine hydrolase [Bryobacterales bacterium]
MKWAIVLLLLAPLAQSYPLDGFEHTGIRRLKGYALSNQNKIRQTVKLPPGALATMADVKLHLRGVNERFDITSATARDAKLQAGLEAIFASRDGSYNIALLDITNPHAPRYAALRADEKYIPGSVAKLFVASGVMGELKRIFPNDTAAREKLLRETVIAAEPVVYRDGKTVPFYNDGQPAIVNRRLETGDKFNLYEWLDHMLSQSSNAAASQVWKESVLLRQYGAQYPLMRSGDGPKQADAWLAGLGASERTAKSLAPQQDALTLSGLDTNKLRVGTLFTSGGGKVFPGSGSYATPNELLRLLVRVEQGRLVDAWSSLELKRLIYFSRPRYRYASSPALANARVYFKSGSLFECASEPGFKCLQYRGNKVNLMHSVAIVESADKVYLVALMSNVLRLNSAVEHQTIATLIERLIQGR